MVAYFSYLCAQVLNSDKKFKYFVTVCCGPSVALLIENHLNNDNKLESNLL